MPRRIQDDIMDLNIDVGDLVKLDWREECSYGVRFGTVISKNSNELSFKVMMYKAGLGQFTRWIHTSRLERVTPVGCL